MNDELEFEIGPVVATVSVPTRLVLASGVGNRVDYDTRVPKTDHFDADVSAAGPEADEGMRDASS